jgi:glycosyltransferase involved in cell wall biosynthesis
MKLVFLAWRDLENPAAGGAEILLDRIMTGLVERGHDVTLLCGGPAGDRPYRVVVAGGAYSQYVLIPLRCATQFRRADVVIDTENGFPYFSPLWRRRPLICAVHHIHTDQWETRFPKVIAEVCKKIETAVMPRVYRHETFVAISRSTANSLEAIGVKRNHVRIIEPGVDNPNGPAQERSKEPVYLSLNRLVPHKRIDLILQAWEIAAKEIPGRLVVAGDGPELDRLRRIADGVPRTNVVGRISEEEKFRLLAQASLLVSASQHEGWGIVILEAATRGTPTLAIDAAGVRDAVLDGVTGILIPSEGHRAVGLAKAWVNAANDPEMLRRMGSAAQHRVSEFNWSSVIDQWIDLLEEVRDVPKRPPATFNG